MISLDRIESALVKLLRGTGKQTGNAPNAFSALAMGLVDQQGNLLLRPNPTTGLLESPTAATSTLASLLPIPSYEVVSATNVILAAENGRTFFLNSETEFVSTLPAPFLGGRFEFVCAAAPASASYTIVTASSADIIKGTVHSSTGGNASSGLTGDTITFADGVAVAGDRVVLVSDGTSWFATAFCDADAGITITEAS